MTGTQVLWTLIVLLSYAKARLLILLGASVIGSLSEGFGEEMGRVKQDGADDLIVELVSRLRIRGCVAALVEVMRCSRRA